MPTVEEFLKFLQERCRTFEMLNSGKVKQEPTTQASISKKKEKRVALAVITSACPLCQEKHHIYNCEEFLKRSVQDRKAEVRKKQLCINCLRAGYYAKECRSSSCRKCSKAHNTLLHVNQTSTQSGSVASSDAQSSEENEKSMTTHCNFVHCMDQANDSTQNNVALTNSSKSSSHSLILLATAQVYVRDVQGNQQQCRVLLDPGSQSHLVTRELIDKLKLPCKRANQIINGVMQCPTEVRYSTSLCVESRYTTLKLK
ncbi:hypothetical protein ALC60_09516 [Trachymyrmex zeteki]|uniref:Uncharacterized protein n=1 Tax=Mycetomoellerius zeteki TaxID=64791 RepID=A0A151WUC6_9HYME|nr:hypothetical protein ALC60_09516 [Trachymyrmex zeteki]